MLGNRWLIEPWPACSYHCFCCSAICCCPSMGVAFVLCALVVEARDCGRLRLLLDVAVLERDRDLPAVSLGSGSAG